MTLKVHRNGIPFHAFKLSCNDFTIALMDKEMKENPPVKVRFMSSYLWPFGFEEAVRFFLDWFQTTFNVNVSGTRVSRLDTCLDSDQIVFSASDIKGIVTRARGKVNHYVSDEFQEGRRFSGLTVGRGNPLLARIYNKTLELTKSQKTWFHQVWEEASWDNTSDVWRVEFQLRREALKEFSIYKLDDVLDKEPGVWAYLTGEWLLLKQPNRHNVSRWPVKKKWKLVQDANYTQKVSPATREKVKLGDTYRLLNQGAGIILSLAALNNHKNIEETSRVLQSWTEHKVEWQQQSFLEQWRNEGDGSYESI